MISKPLHPSFVRLLRLFLALFTLAGVSTAQAIPMCVSDVASLRAALLLSEFQSQAMAIRLVQGNYTLDGSLVYQPGVPLSLEGGYGPNCATRVVDPANTVINIGQNNVVDLRQYNASPSARIAIDGLTFRNSHRYVILWAGKENFNAPDDAGSLRISNSRFSNIKEDDASASITLNAQNEAVEIENVVFDQIGANNECAVSLRITDDGPALINHMTADLELGSDFCFYDGDDDSVVSVYNSILWSSKGGNPGFLSNGEDTEFTSVNSIHNSVVVAGSVSLTNRLNADPRWIDPANGNYRLKTTPLSPAINSAALVAPTGEPATDIEGNPRMQGSAPDRGAYESSYTDQTVLIVSNTQNSGGGSLRQAILDANSSPAIPKQIKFDIRANLVPVCPAVIALTSNLPSIAAPMTIDGYTQPLSTTNTSAEAFNANLCVLIKPAAGTLTVGFHIPAAAPASASLTLRGVGLGGFGQPLLLLGGQGHVIAGNQFGGTANGVALPGAGLGAVNIGVNATGSLIVGGQNLADRNVIGGANFGGVEIQTTVQSSIDKCQVVNNLIGLAANGVTAVPNSVGVNVGGSGCAIVRNRIAGNDIANIWINGGHSNVVQQNKIGFNIQNDGFFTDTVGIRVTGFDNVIGAGGNGGAITANTIRYNVAGGIVIQGNLATGNSVNANLVYDNGAVSNGMDIDQIATGGVAGPTANDAGDADVGPNQLQNYPVAKGLSFTAAGTTNRSGIVTATLDTLPGSYRVDVYFSNTANSLGKRGHAEIFLGRATVVVPPSGHVRFDVAVVVPNQSSGGVISLTATDSLANTSEVGNALSTDTLFADGVE